MTRLAGRIPAPRSFRLFLLALVPILSPTPLFGQSSLGGKWLHQNGVDVVEVMHSGSYLSLRMPRGQVFDGSITGNTIELYHLLDMTEGMPPDLSIEERTVRVEGTVSDGRMETIFFFPRLGGGHRESRLIFTRFTTEIVFLQKIEEEWLEADNVLSAVPYQVEVRFLPTGPNRDTTSVDLTIGDLQLSLEAERIAGGPGRRYRTETFYLWPDDGGLGPPIPRVPGRVPEE